AGPIPTIGASTPSISPPRGSERWSAPGARRSRWRRSCSHRSTPKRWRPCAGCCASSRDSTRRARPRWTTDRLRIAGPRLTLPRIAPVTDERVLLITGASGGIGAQTARRAVEAGWRVALGARGEGALRELADELGGADRAVVARCDVADWDDLQGFARA